MNKITVCTMINKVTKGITIDEHHRLLIYAHERMHIIKDRNFSIEDDFLFFTNRKESFIENVCVPFDAIESITFESIG